MQSPGFSNQNQQQLAGAQQQHLNAMAQGLSANPNAVISANS